MSDGVTLKDLRGRIEALDRQQRRSLRMANNVLYSTGATFGYIAGTHRWLDGIELGVGVFVTTAILHWLVDQRHRIRWTVR